MKERQNMMFCLFYCPDNEHSGQLADYLFTCISFNPKFRKMRGVSEVFLYVSF